MSILIGIGTSNKKDPFAAASEAANFALHQIHHKEITLALLFSTIHFADKRLLEGITYNLGRVPVLGCTGANLITSKGITNYGVGLMLFSCPGKLRLGCAASHNIHLQNARDAGKEFADLALHNLGGTQRDLALIFPDGLIENGSEFLRGIKEAFGLSFPIFGGSSADNLRFHRTFQYFNGQLLSQSIVGAVFAGDNLFGIGLRHGWKPLGRPHLITEAKGNVIKKIEDKPAVSIYEEYFGKTLAEIKKDLIRISIYYPLGIYVAGEAEYLLRNALRIDDDGGLVCQGDAAQGSDARLMMGTKDWALEAATEAAKEARAGLEGKTIKGALIFESISRHKLLGRLTERELLRIKEVLGNIPIIGIGTFGEQAPLKALERHGETYFHNETIAILAIGEPHGSA